jgi:hypothetical protein
MEAKYNSYEGACFTIVWAVFSFRCYFYGSPFTLVTNHQPLKFLMELNWLIGNWHVGHLSYMSMTLTLFIGLVGLIGMSMD